MIRIKNIAHENRSLMSSIEKLNLPKGGFIRVRTRHEVVIDYQTYMLNKDRIILPGGNVRGKVAFRVVDGVQEIEEKSGRREITPPPTTITEPPSIETPDTAENNINIQSESLGQEVIEPPGESNAPIGSEEDTPAEPDILASEEANEEPDIDNAAEDPSHPDEEKDEGSQPPEMPANEGVPLHSREDLEQLSHLQLDVLLKEHGIEVPQRSNKTVKIEALLRLNG